MDFNVSYIIWSYIPSTHSIFSCRKGKTYLDNQEDVIVFSRMDAAFPVNYQRIYPVVKEYQELNQWIKNHQRTDFNQYRDPNILNF